MVILLTEIEDTKQKTCSEGHLEYETQVYQRSLYKRHLLFYFFTRGI